MRLMPFSLSTPSDSTLTSSNRPLQAPLTVSQASSVTIGSVASQNGLTLRAEQTLTQATRQILAAGLSAAPVLSADNRPIGVVSRADLLLAWRNLDDSRADTALEIPEEAAGPLGASHHLDPPIDICVGDVMMPYVIAVKMTDPLTLGASLMAYEGVSQVLVLTKANTYYGVLTALDILRWISRSDSFGESDTKNGRERDERNALFA